MSAPSFVQWRAQARDMLQRNIAPADVVFALARQPQGSLFAAAAQPHGSQCAPAAKRSQASLFAPVASPAPLSRRSRGEANPRPEHPPLVPRAFLALAEHVCCHVDAGRFHLLYRILWRLQQQRQLLDDPADVDVCAARRLQKAVHRDIHKMHAFVRFREVNDDDAVAFPDSAQRVQGSVSTAPAPTSPRPHGEGVAYVAFHRPDFDVVELAAPFFARRFPQMRWRILTPRGSALHDPDGGLTFGPAVAHDPGAQDDVEDLWRTYYAATFNPARLMPDAMRSEMPKKHWSTLPEARLIPGMIQGAGQRTRDNVLAPFPDNDGARRFLPRAGPEGPGLAALADAARACNGCALAQKTATCAPTQVVFGEGPADARLVIVGEQPGDEEDLAGRPFVGPAGRLLDGLLQQAGIERSAIYLTNTVKHFRHELHGKRRLHQRPLAADVKACRPWLEAEIAALAPSVVVCLGLTAARAVVDPRIEVGDARGAVLRTAFAEVTVVSWHPAAILRAEGERQHALRQQLLDDLRLAASLEATKP